MLFSVGLVPILASASSSFSSAADADAAVIHPFTRTGGLQEGGREGGKNTTQADEKKWKGARGESYKYKQPSDRIGGHPYFRCGRYLWLFR